MIDVAKNELPKLWKECDLEEVVRVIRGISFKSSEKLFEPGENTIVCLRTANVQEEVDWNNLWWVPEKFVKRDEQLIQKNDILMSNANSYELVGKVSLVRSIPEKVTLGAFITMLRAEKDVDPRFIFYQLRSSRVVKEIRSRASTTTNISNVSTGKLRDIPLWIAPLEQQKRIAAKIEKLFTHIDAGIASLQAAKKLLKQYRQSVLKAAVTGELTKDWREQNNLSKESWKHSTIGEVANVETGKTPKRSSKEFWGKGTIPWLTSSATNKEFTDHADQFVTQTAVDGGLKLFEPGTLLLAMYGEGKTRGQVTEITFQATCNQACAAITVDEDKVIREFTRIRLYENYEQTRKAASGGNQPNLNLSKVRDISLPLPSLEEQGEIVARVGQKFIFIKRLEIDLEVQLLKAGKNKQSVLVSAFSGSFK